MITDPQIAQMVEHARAEFPNEACGLLAASDGTCVKVYPIANADASPVSYRMDPHEQLKAMLEIDDEGWTLGAVYHSHPRTPAYPSQTDRDLAFYPDALYIILSLANDERPDVRAFSIERGVVHEQPLVHQSETTV